MVKDSPPPGGADFNGTGVVRKKRSRSRRHGGLEGGDDLPPDRRGDDRWKPTMSSRSSEMRATPPCSVTTSLETTVSSFGERRCRTLAHSLDRRRWPAVGWCRDREERCRLWVCVDPLRQSKGFSEAIKLNLSDSTWESEKQKLMKIITAAGREGVGKSELTRRTQWIKDKKSRDSYLSDMQEAGMIIYGANPEHPESRTGWFWARKYAAELIHNMKKIVTE